MSQWSRRNGEREEARSKLPRNLSCPIFFENMSQEDRALCIKKALENMRECKLSGTKTINLSCLGIRHVPHARISASHRSFESAPLNEETDYEKMFSRYYTSTILNLEGNLIEEIPDEIYKLTEIKGLLLRSNRISTLSPNIRELEALTTLTLANNPIRYLPIEVMGLPLNTFTISTTRFLTEKEVEERNSSLRFAPLLSDACLRTMKIKTEKLPPFLDRGACMRFSICSICKRCTTGPQEYFRILPYMGVSVPFSTTVCSRTCLETAIHG